MAAISSLITAKSGNTVRSECSLDVSTRVNTDYVRVHPNANAYYEAIYNSYGKLNKLYKEIAKEIKETNVIVKDEKFQRQAKKIAGNCIKQGQYCLNRRDQLELYFEMALMQAQIAKLEEANN